MSPECWSVCLRTSVSPPSGLISVSVETTTSFGLTFSNVDITSGSIPGMYQEATYVFTSSNGHLSWGAACILVISIAGMCVSQSKHLPAWSNVIPAVHYRDTTVAASGARSYIHRGWIINLSCEILGVSTTWRRFSPRDLNTFPNKNKTETNLGFHHR